MSDEIRDANQYLTDLLRRDTDNQRALLESMGVLPREPGPEGPEEGSFDGGSRDPAPPPKTVEDVETDHNDGITEFVTQLRQKESGA